MAVTPTPEELISDQLVVGTARGPGIWLCSDLTEPWPTDTDDDFEDPWVSLGYASEDGPTISRSADSEDIRGWQALTALRSIITGQTVTIQFQLMQWNPLNLALYWDLTPQDANAAGEFAYAVRSDQGGRRHQLGIDVKDGDNELRLIFPRVSLNDAGDMQFQRGAAAMLDVTFAAQEHAGALAQIFGRIPSSAP